MSARLKFIRFLFGYKITQCIYVVARLNIADYLKSSSKTADELAALSGVNPEALYRVLRCLVSVGVFNEDEKKYFSLNEMATVLISYSENSLRDFAILCGSDLYKTTSELLYTVKTGLPAFDHIHDMDFWEYLDINPDKATIFHNAMGKGSSAQIIKELIEKCDFSSCKTIVDVGGGKGHILCGILDAYPHIQGIVFDLSSAKNAALEYINQFNLSHRCHVITGSFFESVPSGCDVYLLKVVLHDWDDEHAITILKNCRKGMFRQSKLIIIEKIIENGQFKDLACLGDINMLVTLTGKERSLAEFKVLLGKSSLRLEKIINTSISFSVMEVIPI